jgi:hypothetical protein
MILSLPWLVVALILYNLIAFLSSWPASGEMLPPPYNTLPVPNVFDQEVFSLTMISTARWTLTYGDVLVIITLILLFVELIKSTRTGGNSIVDHALSMILFIVCIIEFLTIERAATSTFFIILFTALIDVVAGFSITIRGARRDFGVPTT